MTTLTAKWNFPTTVLFGPGRIKELPAVLKAAGIERPLFVTDPGLAKLPVVASTLAILDEAGVKYGVFSDVKPNPVESNLYAGVEVFKSGKHDGVIAFGGGSALDLGKLIAFQAGQTRPVWDFEDVGDWWTRAESNAIAPIIAVPTTAGTGSEVGRAGVLTNETTHTKKVIFHPKMLPVTVIADPELSTGMPPFITAGTGMDALAHCLEAYCAPGFHPMADGIAVEGIRLVFENLPKAYADGSNVEARANMMAAAAMGATAFQKGLGAIHSLSHPIGALYDTHHGMTNAVFMPYVLLQNRAAIEKRIERLADYLGIDGGFDGFLTAIMNLRSELGVPHTLPEFIKGLEMDGARKDLIADMAIVDPTAGGNPIELTKERALKLLNAALEGKV
ncbi:MULTISPECIES: iron-containing alcohol dehydrogenase [Brucella/Ochrobactrum group]|jgi:alcohol dehydrogenase|uniref:Iron-containing alcohol dehydrogenase n=1 Tax=Brucella pseudintermedia TaxID=370111 RepID=A0ABY5UFG6_9HYPH|nr:MULTISPECIES: iron-containing alcohol dehydrogenase [Brucella/Ochrobactrum group]KAB2684650.1 iron-containing alcohol dehydrogenase [Brucella pseudintermedia]NKE74644.1 iron-containing alcohol dehydrogenase [Ochrobactrum sp. MC-1LL]TWG97572.1 alcohol dehydrogenase [Ochrobactrum sp. J50]UWL62074.1 iron-containing alcohol dehydrogenase [Brucella pseudintermedia]WPM82546.1 iron-containing alcohol dehydrogenase [Brucella pseudintermedia]